MSLKLHSFKNRQYREFQTVSFADFIALSHQLKWQTFLSFKWIFTIPKSRICTSISRYHPIFLSCDLYF